MLHMALAEDLDVSSATGRQLNAGQSSALLNSSANLYQVVQETTDGPRWLTSWDTLEAAMAQAKMLNLKNGESFKTIMWATDRPVMRTDPKKLRFRGDNVLPSLILHPAAVQGEPAALPVSAVYGRQSTVVFTPDGEGIAADTPAFSVQGLGDSEPFATGLTFDDALSGAQRYANEIDRHTVVHGRSRRRRSPMMVVRPTPRLSGLGELAAAGNVVTVVRPGMQNAPHGDLAELASVITISRPGQFGRRR